MRGTAWSTVAVVLLGAHEASAQPAPPDPPLPPASAGRLFGTDEAPPPGVQPAGPHVVMRLAYTRGQGAEVCPDEQFFRDAVAAKVPHWAPFAPNAPWRLEVGVTRRPDGFAGFAELHDVTGALVFRRDFDKTPSCAVLIGDLARAIGLRVDPPAPGLLPAPPGVPAPLPPGPPPSSPHPPTPPGRDEAAPVPPPAARRPALRLGFGTWAQLATAPRPAFGLTVDAGIGVSWFSIALEGRWDPPAGGSVMNGASVSTQHLLGALVPCGHGGWFVGCLVGEVGQVKGTLTPGSLPAGAMTTGTDQTGLHAAGGARIGAEIPVAPHLFLRLSADLLLATSERFFVVTTPSPPAAPAPAPVWTTGTFTGGLGAGLVAAF
jgi:hypothetical protein